MENVTVQRDPSVLLPPLEVRGMTTLQRDLFSKHIVVPWLEIDENSVGILMKHLKKYLLKLPNFKPLQASYILLRDEAVIGSNVRVASSGQNTRRVFLNPSLVATYKDIEEEDRAFLDTKGIREHNLNFSKIVLNYSNWRADEILRAILPGDGLTSYSIIGHIVHINLREYLLPFKQVIGEVLLDKVSVAKTVVNKTEVIDNTYRNFKMELLCGDRNMITRTKENNCLFELDFSNVYWNPRLSTEHERIINKLKKGDVLYDVFSGIGPFAIPAGKKKCCVLANDLNPESYKWLKCNIKLNKVNEFVKAINKDGKEFIENDMKNDMVQKWQDRKFTESAVHITMNLPASAVSFLKSFCGLLKDNMSLLKIKHYPIVHVYCFVTGDDYQQLAKELVEESLGCSLEQNILEICQVRDVSPKKEMMRVSFSLSRDILIGKICKKKHPDEHENSEPSEKKICV